MGDRTPGGIYMAVRLGHLLTILSIALAGQPEVLEYLNYVTDRFDMRKDIQFNTRVTSAHWDESTSLWTIATDDESWTCKYFISASGVLSIGRQLPFQGVEKFKGEV